ncbi:hypothetical protein PRZ48_000872 [Zasmidium cellare]|uniref:Uncharacterized protein n=1 Tax=Zasmidium cellare TaxID=395010 RepID=A0ABR0F109_ZASCE|nr:hypothetical protein PRZ48_000872 [Zasmidium cellare]
MSITITAGLALAVPVKPDLLGERLEAYSKVVPVLRALRLCHRFGKGPKVHVSKLPAEIELVIEGLIIKHEQDENRWGSEWSRAFAHYEGRCEPMSHLEDCWSPLADGVDVEYCETCEEGFYGVVKSCEKRCKDEDADKCWICSEKCDRDNCLRTCEAEMHNEMNELALESDWALDINGDCQGWAKMIDKKGNFAQHEKVLRQHFGLDVSLSPSRIAKEDYGTWPRHVNHRWHEKEQLKTTICYLTLAEHFAPPKTQTESMIEAECGGGILDGTQTIVVKPCAEQDKAKASKRFSRAMNVLGLKAYLHPSQRSGIIMTSPGNDQEGGGPKKTDDSKSAPSDWPQLVLLVKSKGFMCY